MAAFSKLANLWRGRDRSGWRHFAAAIATLALALLLALYSAAMAESGRTVFAALSAFLALALAAWVAIAIVPKMARRTSLRWLLYQVDYRLTREGVIYLAAVFVVALAAVNTGNNLLFMILACLLAGILISGVLSRVVLTGLDLQIDLPEHVFAEQSILANVEVHNEKNMMSSFSLRVVGAGEDGDGQILARPVYFPYIPRESSARQNVELVFPRRGIYRQNAFGIRTKFPFGFLEKTRRVDSEMELVVYPRVEPTSEFYEILPLLSGEIESMHRGRGYDLHSIREYTTNDSVRFVDWKASAKSGSLKIREFAREDERRLILALDPSLPLATSDAQAAKQAENFENAVSLTACIAWHFFEARAVMQFITPPMTTPMTAASDIIYAVLRQLAYIQPDIGGSGAAFLESLVPLHEIFKIVLTSQPHGSIPTPLWSSSYFIFLDSL